MLDIFKQITILYNVQFDKLKLSFIIVARKVIRLGKKVSLVYIYNALTSCFLIVAANSD